MTIKSERGNLDQMNGMNCVQMERLKNLQVYCFLFFSIHIGIAVVSLECPEELLRLSCCLPLTPSFREYLCIINKRNFFNMMTCTLFLNIFFYQVENTRCSFK